MIVRHPKILSWQASLTLQANLRNTSLSACPEAVDSIRHSPNPGHHRPNAWSFVLIGVRGSPSYYPHPGTQMPDHKSFLWQAMPGKTSDHSLPSPEFPEQEWGRNTQYPPGCLVWEPYKAVLNVRIWQDKQDRSGRQAGGEA